MGAWLLQAKETWDMSVDEKLGVAARRKELGNRFFKAQQWRRALKKYKDAAQVVDYEVRLRPQPVSLGALACV